MEGQALDCDFLCGCWWSLSHRILSRRLISNRSIFRLKTLEGLHFRRAHDLGSSQFIASEIVALANFLVDGALDIAKRVLRIAPARPGERVAQEAQSVGIRREPRFIKSGGIVMRFGLNRYAVLGRSSRLWSSVVLDQAFLLALLPA